MTLLATDLSDLCPSLSHPKRIGPAGLEVSHQGQLMLQLSLHVMPSVVAIKSLWIVFITESHGISS